jgi:hypothetical protein
MMRLLLLSRDVSPEVLATLLMLLNLQDVSATVCGWGYTVILQHKMSNVKH